MAEAIGTQLRFELLKSSLICTGRVTRVPGLQADQTPFGLKFIGELTNEKQIIPIEDSAGLAIKSHSTEKDGVPACLHAAKKNKASRANLTDKLNPPKKVGNIESGQIGVRPTPELMRSLNKESGRLGYRKGVRFNRSDAVKFIFADGLGCRFFILGPRFFPHRCRNRIS